RSHGVAGSAAGAAASADLMGVMVRTTSCGALPLLPSGGRTGPGMALNYVMACRSIEARGDLTRPPSRLRRYGGQPARELRLKCPPSRLRRYGGQPSREL